MTHTRTSPCRRFKHLSLFVVGVFGEEVIQGYAAPARDLPTSLLFIVNFILGLVGILALVFLVYGGFRYITSRGDDTEIEAAKGMIRSAIIGLVVIGIAAAVVNFFIGSVLTPVGPVVPPPT